MNSDQNVKKGNNDKSDNNYNHYIKLVEHAHIEIEWVRKAYKWVVSIIGLIIIAGGVLAYLNFNDLEKNIESFKTETREDLNGYLENIKINLNNVYEGHKFKSEVELDKIQNEIKKSIQKEFDDRKIKLLVENEAKIRIDEIADSLINKNIQIKIEPRLDEAKEKLTIIDQKVVQSEEVQKNLEELIDFSMTLLSAENGDRKAFDKLTSYFDNKSDKFSKMASEAYITIRLSYTDIIDPGYLNVEWKEYGDPQSFDIDKFILIYKELPHLFHVDIVKRIWESKIINKDDKIHFLIDVLENGENLTAVFYAGKFLSNETNIKWSPFSIKPFVEWYIKKYK